jgi:hypothetical protein
LWSRGSSVNRVFLTTDWTAGRSKFYPRQRQKDFSPIICVQTGSETHPTSCPIGTGDPFPGGITRPERDAACAASVEVMNEQELYVLSLHRLGVLKDFFTLLFYCIPIYYAKFQTSAYINRIRFAIHGRMCMNRGYLR